MCDQSTGVIKETADGFRIDVVKCHRKTWENGSCYLHNTNENRSHDEIDKLIEADFENPIDGIVNLSGIALPRRYKLRFPKYISSSVVLDNSTLNSELVIGECVIEGILSMRGITANGGIKISNSQFKKHVFLNVYSSDSIDELFPVREPRGVISGLSIDSSQFAKRVNFRFGVLKNSARLNQVLLEGGIDFHQCNLECDIQINASIFKGDSHLGFIPRKIKESEFQGLAHPRTKIDITFSICDLSGALLTTLPMEDANIEFSAITNWDLNWRNCHAIPTRDDEVRTDIVSLQQLYSNLENYHYAKRDVKLANASYVSLMKARSRDKGDSFAARTSNRLYKWLSNYGSSVVKPLSWIALVWCIIPFALLQLGSKVPDTSTPSSFVYREYELSLSTNSTETVEFLTDYFSVLIANIAYSTTDRRNQLAPYPGSIQHLLVMLESLFIISMAALLIIAMRRQFTPKKPTIT